MKELRQVCCSLLLIIRRFQKVRASASLSPPARPSRAADACSFLSVRRWRACRCIVPLRWSSAPFRAQQSPSQGVRTRTSPCMSSCVVARLRIRASPSSPSRQRCSSRRLVPTVSTTPTRGTVCSCRGSPLSRLRRGTRAGGLQSCP